MKCILFGLTGFGNKVINGLLTTSLFEEITVVTRKEKGVFPYYHCEQLADFCKRKKITYHTGLNLKTKKDIDFIRRISPDIIIVATFHQIISKEIFNLPEFGSINIHPSLLPHYKGPNPTHWAIINGESISGITFHQMTADIDAGDILWKRKIALHNFNDGELRQRLAGLAEQSIAEFVTQHLNDKITPIKQNLDEGSYFPRVSSPEGRSLLRSGKFELKNIVRGLTPFPGLKVFYQE